MVGWCCGVAAATTTTLAGRQYIDCNPGVFSFVYYLNITSSKLCLGYRILEHMGVMQASPMSWNGAPPHAGTPVVKKLVRLDVPVDKYPNFNFVGCLLGPRGNSLKRVEARSYDSVESLYSWAWFS